MMNVYFKLRRQETFCTPKGPSFNSAKTVAFTIDNTEIVFKAPKDKSGYSSREQIKPSKSNLTADMAFRTYPEDLVKDDSWKYTDIWARSWGFWGPWFSGAVAELPSSITLVKSTEKNNGSYFHPRAFETVVSDYISQQFSHEFSPSNDKQYWLAPIDWKPIQDGVKFKVIPNPETFNSDYISEYAIFPIADDILMIFYFGIQQHAASIIEDKDKLVDRKPLEKLASDIINSIKITLSQEAQAQKDNALEGLDDTSLSPSFAPLKWSNSEQLINTNDDPDTLSLNNN